MYFFSIACEEITLKCYTLGLEINWNQHLFSNEKHFSFSFGFLPSWLFHERKHTRFGVFSYPDWGVTNKGFYPYAGSPPRESLISQANKLSVLTHTHKTVMKVGILSAQRKPLSGPDVVLLFSHWPWKSKSVIFQYITLPKYTLQYKYTVQ